MRNKKEYAWFGCADCMIEQQPDKSKSTDNLNVYATNVRCPKCGKIMTIHAGEPPEEVVKNRHNAK